MNAHYRAHISISQYTLFGACPHTKRRVNMAFALSKLRKVLGSSTHLLLSFHEHVATIIDMHPYHEYVVPIIDIHHYQQYNVYYVC